MYDEEIREELFFFLEERYGKSRVIEEKVIGKARADCVLITENAFIGVEIKSDHDTYQRLSEQVKQYNSFFDYNILVVGTKHAHSAKDHVSPFWGIITVEEVEGKPDFYPLRKEQRNPYRDYIKKGSLLWKEELVSILEKYGFPLYRQKSKKVQFSYLKERLSEDELDREMSFQLLERTYPEGEALWTQKKRRRRKRKPNLLVSHVLKRKNRKDKAEG